MDEQDVSALEKESLNNQLRHFKSTSEQFEEYNRDLKAQLQLKSDDFQYLKKKTQQELEYEKDRSNQLSHVRGLLQNRLDNAEEA